MKSRPWLQSFGLRVAIAVFVLLEAPLWGLIFFRHLPILGIPIGLPIAMLAQASGTGHRHFATWPAVVVDRNGVLSVLSVHDPEAEEARTHPAPGVEVRADVWCWPTPRSFGLAAPALVSYEHTVHIMPTGQVGFSALEYASIRKQYAAFVSAEWLRSGEAGSPYPRLLASGDGTSVLVQPLWLVHDLLVVGLIGVFFASCYHGSLKPAWARRRLARDASKLMLDRCPSCDYSVAGLERGHDAKCPECGRALAP